MKNGRHGQRTYDVDRWDTQFPFIKILLFEYCSTRTRVCIARVIYHTCCYTRSTYKSSMISKYADSTYGMKWNNSWREATYVRFFRNLFDYFNVHAWIFHEKRHYHSNIFINIRFARLTWRVIALSNRLLCVVHVRGIYCLINAQVLARLFTLVTRFHVIMNTFAAIDV